VDIPFLSVNLLESRSIVWTYFIKRILWFFPTLGIISLLAFMLGAFSPIDPIETKCDQISQGVPYQEVLDCLDTNRKKYNLYLPIFYLEIGNLAEPNTLHQIDRKSRSAYERLLDESGNWSAVENYFLQLQGFYDRVGAIKPASFGQGPDTTFRISKLRGDLLNRSISLLRTGKSTTIIQLMKSVEDMLVENPQFSELPPAWKEVQSAWERLNNERAVWKVYIPRIIWHGTDCQYHQWLKKILTEGDFGTSYVGDWKVGEEIRSLFFYSFFFAVVSILLAYLIGIGLGILSAWYHHRWPDKVIGISVFALDSMPSFWVATMLIILFANPDMIDWFPSSFNSSGNYSFLARITLPLIAYTYGAFAAMSRIMRISLLEVMQQDYITTARAKGLNEKKIMFKHALRNALLPMITSFAGVFPALLGGSVILEKIFEIPGMGRAIIEAVLSENMPMILAVVTLVGMLTMLGYLFTDLLYAWVDPRIRFGKK
jgi:peptide/nickel transport system permease protein